MKIKTNNGKEIQILEKSIIVKDGKLFNKETNFYEAIDGDKICFLTYSENGYKITTIGTVEGYTCNGEIKLRNVKLPYKVVNGYTIEHQTKIIDFEDENAVVAEIVYAE